MVAIGTMLGAITQLLTYIVTKRNFNKFSVVKGIVVSSKLDNHNDVEGKRVYRANIRFQYTLNGRVFEADTAALRSFQMLPFFNYEDELLEKYSEGEPVDVHYFPEKPSRAYLEVAPFSLMSMVALIVLTAAQLGYLKFLKGL